MNRSNATLHFSNTSMTIFDAIGKTLQSLMGSQFDANNLEIPHFFL